MLRLLCNPSQQLRWHQLRGKRKQRRWQLSSLWTLLAR